jgi:hypothetical protein
MSATDVLYNPEIILSVMDDMEFEVKKKCAQLQKDADFMCTSIKQKFQVEIIKLPKDVKKMSLAKFREEYGDDIGNVIRASSSISSSSSKSKNSSSNSIYQTPSGKKGSALMSLETPSTALRRPKVGEVILSENGSPLGAFEETVVKSNPNRSIAPPATPGDGGSMQVSMGNGDVLDIGNVDVDTMDQEAKDDALAKMQAMMENMQALMNKLNQK